MLLFVTENSAWLYRAERACLTLVQRFAGDATEMAAFEQQVAAGQGRHYAVLIDVAEEDFIVDQIPHVKGRDHRALMKRKLQSLFRGNRYANGWVQGREAAGRRDDRVLFSGLLNPALLDRWLDILERHQAPLVGVYSLALLCNSLAKRLHHADDHLLLVSIQAESGLRQCYYRQGELKFSRLTSLATDQPDLVGQIVEECVRTKQYVASLRMISRDAVLHVLVVADDEHHGQLAALPPSNDAFRYELIGVADIAQAFKLTPAGEQSLAQILLRLIRRGWRNHYAPPERLRWLRLWQVRRALLQAAAASLVVGLGAAAWLLSQARSHEQQYNAWLPVALADEAKTQAVLITSGEFSPVTMRQTVNAVDQIRREWPAMGAAWLLLSHALDNAGDLHLAGLEWTVSAQQPYRLDDEAANEMPVPQAEQGAEGATANPQPTPHAWSERLVVRGLVEPWSDDYRRADISVGALAQRLQRRDAQIDITMSPLDTRATGEVSLPPQQTDIAPPQHPFELVWSRQIVPRAP
ncbi:hypothetical protein HNQ59_002777 [Chitinivorax tropicus]|uniref:Uncharacterized protein n=1 Tax=Chitinivorax tropicus TaxID=714531 RepID=A0A840MPU9_9PROT|nr:hypothetical protein [Chitinivorax tropicus]MBB5019475.1 hypothetical protein [Chitinivorax tropicus]